MSLWTQKLRKNQHIVINKGKGKTDIKLFGNGIVEAQFVMAVPVLQKYNTGFIAVINPRKWHDDFTFLFILSTLIAGDLNEIKLEERIDIVIRQQSHCAETDVYVKAFGSLEIRGSKGVLTDEQITSDQCYRMLSYMLLNSRRKRPARELADVIWNDVPLNDPYHDLKNVVYRLKRCLASAGLEDFIIGSGGTFIINPRYNVYSDFELFETMCFRYFDEEDPELSICDYYAAKDIYKGLLFPRCEHSHYFLPVYQLLQNLYLKLLKTYLILQYQHCNHLCVQKTALDGS